MRGTERRGRTTGVGLRLQNFHITFFAIVLGMAGFSLAVQKLAGGGIGLVPKLAGAATILVGFTVVLFAAIGVIYAAKAARYPAAVADEMRHPVKISFFPLVAKILLVLSVIFLDRSMAVSRGLWMAGTALQLMASLLIISSWMHHARYAIEHVTPAWFIPIVGALIVPIAGVAHGFVEISWFFFAIGLIFWGVLFTVLMYRLVFHPPIPSRLLPTLFILFAPPAIGFISYAKLVGLTDAAGPDAFARILYYFSLFVLALVLLRARVFARIRFALSWWAYSFPLAAHALATILMLHLTHVFGYRVLALVEVAILTALIAGLIVLTVRSVLRSEICVAE